MYHPRKDGWNDHCELRGNLIGPRTAVGRVTVNVLQLNRVERVKEREPLIRAGMLER